ncbi:hypothetical protein PaG_06159 [Moesziomyces aphidis]|uniref:DASH complex subunit DUO1 n=1 Tax=Moesziomyces aphidis TaxID=84754 RepID=W3VE75_MOEAP|nr:hypothetical protein PaG_06159 [Moesziomyces aphidis]
MPALPTTPKPSGPDADSSWLLDENLSPGLVQGSMQNLHLADSPLTAPLQSTAATNRASQPRASKPIKSRPSWGSAVVLDAQHSANAISGMRLLAGIQPNDENKPPVSRKPPTSSSSTAGAPARPRFSLFAKPGVPTNLVPKKPHNASTASQHDDDDDDDLTLHGLPDVSALASSSSHAPDASAASAYIPDDDYIRDALLGKPASAAVATGAPTPVESKESQEHAARQLAELRRINDVFEAFETSLRGSAGQINAFARRVRDTDDLLNIYISLLRQTEKTQQLLQDQDWKGTTKDAEAHKESLAIAHRETQRLHAEALAREQEAKRAAQLAAQQAEELQRRQQEEARRAAGPGARGRGGRTVSTGTRGAARGGVARATSSRTASKPSDTQPAATATASTRGRSASASTRGTARPSAIPTRTPSGSAGLGGQYANVKSSGYGPR